MSWSEWAETQLQAIHARSRFRTLVTYDGVGPLTKTCGQPILSFASNDYLGLSQHAQVRAAALDAVEQFGTGSAASRLVTGTRDLHTVLEQRIAKWQCSERALAFSSGYVANLAALTVVGGEDVTIFSDALNHASIIDGCRLSKARIVVYPHCDLAHLATLMGQFNGRKVVVTETVFSMDGDVAQVEQLAHLCKRHDALLLLDESHAVLQPALTFDDLAVLRVGSLSKTLGSLGGWVAGPRSIIELLVNRARPFIFSTALSPADAAAALAALTLVTSDEGARLRAHLRTVIAMLKPKHRTPIVPIFCGSETAALDASARLLAQGIHVPAIRPPTVPERTSRLRVSLSAAHSFEMVARLKCCLTESSWKSLDLVG